MNTIDSASVTTTGDSNYQPWFERPSSIITGGMDYHFVQIDTGWRCCVCGLIATVNGDGCTWCWKHWQEWDLGHGNTIHEMRLKVKKEAGYEAKY